MEIYTFEDIKNEVYGEVGTPRRDKMEEELANLGVGVQVCNEREAKKMTQSQLAGEIGEDEDGCLPG